MGIPGLWDILGDGEITHIADLSAEYFKRTGRPLRVAVDEAGWRFKNLTEWQVAQIRQKVPEANPIEKAILWRLVRLMRMNIQFLFVFDGPSRPWKHGSTAGHIDWKKIDLLRKVLDVLKIPHHRAPAEAEAECARLQQLGIVDAVWSDDGDSLMFGAGMLIRDYREGGGKLGKKSDSLVRVYRADCIARKHGLNRQRLLLFVLLVGGDYDAKGLEGCGPKTAYQAVKYDNGRLSQMLYEIPLRQLDSFTESLRDYFQKHTISNVYVPPKYPRDMHVKNYREPKVSTDEQAQNLRGLKKGWDVAIEEPRLRPFLRERFDFWTRGYIKHVLPAFLTKTLVQTTPDGVRDNLVFNIEFVYKRGVNAHDPCKERKITFSPLVATNLDLKTQPETEDWSVYTGKEGIVFDPSQPVEVELPDYILERGLGATEMQRLKEEANKPKPRKRKANDAVAAGPSHAESSNSGAPSAVAAASVSAPAVVKKRKTTTKAPTTASGSTKGKCKATANKIAEEPQPPESKSPPKRFRLPPGLQRDNSMQEISGSNTPSFQSYTSSSSQAPSASASFSALPFHAPPSSQAHQDADAWSSLLPGSGRRPVATGQSTNKSLSNSQTPTSKRSAAPMTSTDPVEATTSRAAACQTSHTPTHATATAAPVAAASVTPNTTSRTQAVILDLTSDDEETEPPTQPLQSNALTVQTYHHHNTSKAPSVPSNYRPLLPASADQRAKVPPRSPDLVDPQVQISRASIHAPGMNGSPRIQDSPACPASDVDTSHPPIPPPGFVILPSKANPGGWCISPTRNYRPHAAAHALGTQGNLLSSSTGCSHTAWPLSANEPPSMSTAVSPSVGELGIIGSAATAPVNTGTSGNYSADLEKRRKHIAAARLKHFEEMNKAEATSSAAVVVAAGNGESAPAATKSAGPKTIDLTLDD